MSKIIFFDNLVCKKSVRAYIDVKRNNIHPLNFQVFLYIRNIHNINKANGTKLLFYLNLH